MFRHLSGPLVDLSPALNNNQVYAGVELGFAMPGAGAGWGINPSVPSSAERGIRSLSWITRPRGQSRESNLAPFHGPVEGPVPWTMLVLFSTREVCGQKVSELPPRCPTVICREVRREVLFLSHFLSTLGKFTTRNLTEVTQIHVQPVLSLYVRMCCSKHVKV